MGELQNWGFSTVMKPLHQHLHLAEYLTTHLHTLLNDLRLPDVKDPSWLVVESNYAGDED